MSRGIDGFSFAHLAGNLGATVTKRYHFGLEFFMFFQKVSLKASNHCNQRCTVQAWRPQYFSALVRNYLSTHYYG